MATFAKQISCFFLIIFSSHLQAQARESKFFSKYLHLTTTNTFVTIPTTNPKHVSLSSPAPSPSPTTSQISGIPASAPMAPDSGPTLAPAPTTLGAGYGPAPAPITLGVGYDLAPAPATLGADYAPTPAPLENDTPYYGLYAKDTNNEEEEFPSENPEELNNRESYSYGNGESSRLSNNNGFWTSDHKSYYNTNNGYDLDGGYKSEPQGMSDSRLVENGRYYYDVGREKYNPSGSNYKDDNEEGYYGNYKSKYEFDSMEEYEKQEGYGDVEQEFIP